MSLSLNGSNRYVQSFSFQVSDVTWVGEARRFAATLCEDLEFTEERAGQVGIIVNELGNNLAKYADGGELIFRCDILSTQNAIHIISLDRGPGMSDTGVTMRDGYTTGATPGTGLGAVRRLSDSFDIYSDGKGTIISSVIASRIPLEVSSYEIGAINLPVSGEEVSGDAWAVRVDGESLTVLHADGLGHGQFAHNASMQAIEIFKSSSETKVDTLLMQAHNALKSTRGAAVFLLHTPNKRELQFSGVGNIRAVLCDHDRMKTLISQNGTAGLHVRGAKLFSDVWPEDMLLVLHSDGVQSRWDFISYNLIERHHPNIVAGALYRDYRRPNDDSSIVVIASSK